MFVVLTAVGACGSSESGPAGAGGSAGSTSTASSSAAKLEITDVNTDLGDRLCVNPSAISYLPSSVTRQATKVLVVRNQGTADAEVVVTLDATSPDEVLGRWTMRVGGEEAWDGEARSTLTPGAFVEIKVGYSSCVEDGFLSTTRVQVQAPEVVDFTPQTFELQARSLILHSSFDRDVITYTTADFENAKPKDDECSSAVGRARKKFLLKNESRYPAEVHDLARVGPGILVDGALYNLQVESDGSFSGWETIVQPGATVLMCLAVAEGATAAEAQSSYVENVVEGVSASEPLLQRLTIDYQP